MLDTGKKTASPLGHAHTLCELNERDFVGAWGQGQHRQQVSITLTIDVKVIMKSNKKFVFLLGTEKNAKK